MVDKVNDKDITGEMVNNMTKQELKNFENRLRSKAKSHNFKTHKSKHPVYGNIYMLTDDKNEKEVSGVDLCELKEYLYTAL